MLERSRLRSGASGSAFAHAAHRQLVRGRAPKRSLRAPPRPHWHVLPLLAGPHGNPSSALEHSSSSSSSCGGGGGEGDGGGEGGGSGVSGDEGDGGGGGGGDMHGVLSVWELVRRWTFGFDSHKAVPTSAASEHT